MQGWGWERRQRADGWVGVGAGVPGGPPTYQMSEASLTGVCSMISGDTNSGEPYLLYCGSVGVIFWAKPKSQILISSRAGCTIRMLGGYWEELRTGEAISLKGVTSGAAGFGGGTLQGLRGCPMAAVQPAWASEPLGVGFSAIWGCPLLHQSCTHLKRAASKVVSSLPPEVIES